MERLYGWDRVSRRVHIASGVMVALSGLASGVFVVAVNAWMNTPAGFTVEDGVFSNIDLVTAFFSPAFPTQALHMALAAYTSVAFIVMGIHAWRLLRAPRSDFHRKAFSISFALALVSTPLQILSGDLAAKHIAEHQPTKLAAAEALFRTERGAGISIGGLVNEAEGKLEGAIVVPYALSVLAKGDPTATVQGLEDFPRDEWPPVAIVHYAFQVMVGAGFIMLAIVLWGAVRWVRMKRRWTDSRAFLTAATIAGSLGLIAVEAGWFVTEVGRQPWIIRGIMKTSEAVTPMPYLVIPFMVFSALYLMLGLVVLLLLRAYVSSAPENASPESVAEPVSPPAGRRPQTRPAS
jgi:cytochrome d ubiquinol oxidase subunit I